MVEMIRESPERKDGTEKKRKDPERGCEGVVGRVDLGKWNNKGIRRA